MTAPPVDNPDPLAAAAAAADVLYKAPAPPPPPPPPAIVELLRPIGELAGGDVFGSPPPRQEWLLERRPRNREEEVDAGGPEGSIGFLPMGEVGMLSSAGGAGKTMALIELGLAIAAGRNWLGVAGDKMSGYYVPTTSIGRSALFLAEENELAVRRRLYDAGKTIGLTAAEVEDAKQRMMIAPLKGRPSPLTRKNSAGETEETEHMRAIRAHLTELAAAGPWRLIVIDPLARFADASAEVDNSGATKFVQFIESLLFVNGPDHPAPTIIMAHHTSKAARANLAAGAEPSGTDARGASALVDSTRWGSTLTETPREVREALGYDVARFALVKSNYGPSAPIMHLRRGRGGRLCELTAAELAAFERCMAEHSKSGGGGKAKSGKAAPPSPERSRTESESAVINWRDNEPPPTC
jgi:RecA-family ATPase